MDGLVLGVFAAVYLGLMLGRLPGLSLDRSGIALMGAIALLVAGRLSPTEARDALDVPTLVLLFGLMVVSAQFRLGGFYSAVARRLGSAPLAPHALLGLLVLTAGVLSAVLVNDIVCLAMTPLLVETCVRRRLDPVPFLLALACASNVGSAATLIGNPQNILVGQALSLSFAGYLLDGGVPAMLGLLVVWGVVTHRAAGRWHAAPGRVDVPGAVQPPAAPPFDRWQTAKGLLVAGALVVLFLDGRWPRELLALGAAGLLLLSRRMASRRMLALVDWQLLLLFAGLFVVHAALARTGALEALLRSARDAGVDPSRPLLLFPATVLLSNLVSNVPAVMLLLPAATHPLAGPVLALASTLAGNLLLVGSIANLIVAEQAGRLGVHIGWREHVRVGLPVTLGTLALAAGWLALRAA